VLAEDHDHQDAQYLMCGLVPTPTSTATKAMITAANSVPMAWIVIPFRNSPAETTAVLTTSADARLQSCRKRTVALLNPPLDIDLAGIEPEPCPVGCCVPWLLDCRMNDYLLNYQP
jgi:hypothetical protein